MKVALYLANFLYVPVSKTALEFVVCSPGLAKKLREGFTLTGYRSDYTDCQCTSFEGGYIASVAAYFVLAAFSIALPIVMYHTIQSNKPKGSQDDPSRRRNAQGQLVPFSDAMYQDDLRNDPRQRESPFLFLYKDLTRQAAYWQVIVLFLKVLLTFSASVLASGELPQLATNVAALATFAVFQTTPYLSYSANVLDVCGRGSMLLTAGLTLTGFLLEKQPNSQVAIGYIIIAVNAVYLATVVGVIASGWTWVRLLAQRASRNLLSSPADNSLRRNLGSVLCADGKPQYSTEQELLKRVWQPALRSVLRSADPAAAERLAELHVLAQQHGRAALKRHFIDLTIDGVADDRAACMREIDGVDVYWDRAPGVLATSCFAKAHVVAFPFHVCLAYDDDDMTAQLHSWEDIRELVQLNRHPKVQQRRRNRAVLRIASEWNAPIDMKPDTIGASETVRVRVRVAEKKSMSRGFDLEIVRTEVKQGTCCAQQRKESGGADSVGFSHHFDAPRYNDYPRKLIRTALTQLQADGHDPETERKTVVDLYRAEAVQEENAKQHSLSNAFYPMVFSNIRCDLKQFIKLLSIWETNPLLEPMTLMKTQGRAVNEPIQQMQRLVVHPQEAFWYCFWDALWNCNRGLDVIESNVRLLDPSRDTAIAHHRVGRAELLAQLQGTGLTDGYCLRAYIGAAQLDALYGTLATLREMYGADRKAAWLPYSEYEQHMADRKLLLADHRARSRARSDLVPLLAEAGVAGWGGSSVGPVL